MMNDELREEAAGDYLQMIRPLFPLQFIIHHSAFIVVFHSVEPSLIVWFNG